MEAARTLTGLRERFGSEPGLRSRFSAAVPVEDQWIEVGIFLVNTRTGERKLNNRHGAPQSIDTPTMTAPAQRPAGLARIPDPVEQPRSSHNDPRIYPESQRYAGIVDLATGQPRQRPGLATPMATTDNLYEEPGFVEAGINAWDRGVAGMAGTFGAFSEMVGRGMQPDPDPADRMSPAQRAALEKARQLYGVGGPPPSAMGMATHAAGIGLQREGQEIQSRVEREQQAIPRPEYARDFWSGMETDPLKTATIGALENLPQLVTTIGAAAAGGPLAGGAMAGIQEAGGAYQETEGLPEEERRQIAGWVGATNMFLEYLPAGKLLKTLKGGDSVAAKGVMRLTLEQATAEGGTESVQELNQILSQLFMSAHSQNISVDELGKRVAEAGFTGAILGLAGGGGASVATGPSAGAATPALGLRERFAQAKQKRQTEALTGAGWRFEEQPDGTTLMTKPEDEEPSPTVEIGEDGVPRPTAYGREVLGQVGFPSDLDSWISKTTGEDPDVLTYREKLDYYGQMVAEERAERERFHATPPEPPAAQPELTPGRWEELKAMNQTRSAAAGPEDLPIGHPAGSLTPRIPRWASTHDEALAGWESFVDSKRSGSGIVDPQDLPFELVNLPLTRFDSGHDYSPRGGRFYLLGDQTQYFAGHTLIDSDKWKPPGRIKGLADKVGGLLFDDEFYSGVTGGHAPQTELFTPRNPLVIARTPELRGGIRTDAKLIADAERAGHDAIIVFNRSDDAGRVEVIKTEHAAAGAPRRSLFVDTVARFRNADEAHFMAERGGTTPESYLAAKEAYYRTTSGGDSLYSRSFPEYPGPEAMRALADGFQNMGRARASTPWHQQIDSALDPTAPPRAAASPLATGLWERFQSRRPTATTAPFDQRLAAAAYDRGLVKTQEELSDLLAQATQFAPAQPGRAGADAAIRDALEALRTRPETGPASPAPATEVVRPSGWRASNDVPESWTRSGHFYRGMTDAEFAATLGQGRGVVSRQDSSVPGEGTSFSANAADAESYINFGRDDPRSTGRPTYLVEVSGDDGLRRDRDGYYKAANEIPRERITRAWRFSPDESGALVAAPHDLAVATSQIVGKPSEAGFIRLRSEPPPPDTPEGAAMEAFIGDANLPPMTMTERFDALRQGVQSFYTEAVNLDAPVERLGKRKGAPGGMKRSIELQIQKVRGAGDIAKNMAESRNDVESLWSIWNGAGEAAYRDWRRIGAAEREMELVERAEAGDEIEIDQDAADVARDYLANVAPQLRAQNQRLDRLITETRRWSRDNIIEPFVEAGILSRAQADEIVAKNQAHLPFNRVQRAVEAVAAGTQDEMARAKVHRITAGLSEIDKIREPMESILQRAHHARVIAEQQKARNILADFVEQAPDIFPEIKRVETKAMPVAVVEDKTIFRRKPTKTKKTEAFPVWRDGEMQIWEGPTDVMNVVNFLGPHELEGGLKAIHRALSLPGQMMRAGVTSTLEFALYRNPAFDQFEAFINSKAGFVPVLDTLRGLFHVAGKTQLWDDAMRAGAGNSVLVAIDRPETVTRISSVMQEQGLAGSIRSAMDAWRDAVFPTSGRILGIPGAALGRAPGARGFAPTRIALTPLQAASQVMEAPTRMGGYLAAERPMPWNRAVRRVENMLVPASQRVGMGPLGPELAMEEFRSNTLDFLRGGRTGKLLNGPEAFLNAEIQGWDKLARSLKYRPGPTLLKAIAAFTIPALAHWEMNHDDEEYQREPEWKKMLFFRLPLPNGTSVPVPRGRGLLSTIFGYLVEKVLDHAAETDPDAARDVVAALVDNTPTHYGIDVRRSGGVMPSLDLIPTAMEPEVEIATNYDAFRDAPVEPRGKISLLPADRFSASTSPTLQAMSEATPFSPIQLQHLVRGHFGGVGQYATDLADQFVGSDFQELPPDNQLPAPLDWVPTDAPLIKGMVSREPVGFSSRPVQDFYAILERATQARNSFKAADEAGRYERADEIAAEHPEMDWAEDLERAAKNLGEIRKEWNEIRALPPDAATPEEIRELLHDLDVEATLVAEDALRGVGLMK